MLEKIKNAGIKIARIIKNIAVNTWMVMKGIAGALVEVAKNAVQETLQIADEHPRWMGYALVISSLVGMSLLAREQDAYREGGNDAIHGLLCALNNCEENQYVKVTDAAKYADENGNCMTTNLRKQVAVQEPEPVQA